MKRGRESRVNSNGEIDDMNTGEPRFHARLRQWLLGMAFLLLLAVPALGGQASSPTPSELPPLAGDEFSFGRGINNGGFVVGDSRSDSGQIDTAVVWDPDGTPMELFRLDPVSETFGRGINDRGETVGISRTGLGPCGASNPNATETAVKWSIHGVPMVLPPLPGDVESRAFAINNNGVVVGRSLSVRAPHPTPCRGSTSFTAVVWDREGNPTPLPTSLAESFAEAINESGQIAGGEITFVPGAVVENTLVWDKTTYASSILPLPIGALNSFGAGINNRGWVVGSAFFPSIGPPEVCTGAGNVRWVVLWDRKGNSTILKGLSTGCRGSRFVGGGGINNSGTAVGWSKGQNNIDTAVVWDGDGVPTALPPLAGYLESFAYGINDAGQIVGTSQFLPGVFHARATVWR